MKLRRYVFRIVMTIFILFPVLALGQFAFFPQETRCILVDCSGLQKDGDLYYEKETSPEKIIRIKALIADAEKRIIHFWGGHAGKPKFIYCDDDADYKKYGGQYLSPACSHMKFCGYIVISQSGVDIDVISHELSHIELYTRVGFWKNTLSIPAWFHEGIAMQVDNRPDFSTDSLLRYSSGFKNMPDLKSLKTARLFNSGSPDQVILNYAAARYMIGQWYTPRKLENFIGFIRKGLSFENAFRNT